MGWLFFWGCFPDWIHQDHLRESWFTSLELRTSIRSQASQSNKRISLPNTFVYMSEACRDRFRPAGLSYDMTKCFDRVPVIFSFAYLQSSWCRLQSDALALSGFYNQHTKFFTLDGACSTKIFVVVVLGFWEKCLLTMWFYSSAVFRFSLCRCEHEGVPNRSPYRLGQPGLQKPLKGRLAKTRWSLVLFFYHESGGEN